MTINMLFNGDVGAAGCCDIGGGGVCCDDDVSACESACAFACVCDVSTNNKSPTLPTHPLLLLPVNI